LRRSSFRGLGPARQKQAVVRATRHTMPQILWVTVREVSKRNTPASHSGVGIGDTGSADAHAVAPERQGTLC
jgi:hypothetical protein